jgi:adenylate cyclase
VSDRAAATGSRRRARHLVASAVLGFAASLGAGVLVVTGVTGPVEAVLVDRLQRLRGERPVDPRVVLVEIDARSLDRYGRWPWPRTRIAELIRALDAGGASVIALDVVFGEPSRFGPGFDLRSEDEELAATLAEAGSVVLSFFLRESVPLEAPVTQTGGGARFRADPANVETSRVDLAIEPPGGFPLREYPAVAPNLNLFAAAAASQGFVTAERQAGVARHVPLIARYRGEVYPSLPVRAVQRHLGAPLEVAADARGLPAIRLSGATVVTDGRGRLWLDYPGPGRRLDAVSVVDVLEGRAPPAAFRDRVVLVGATDPGLGDTSATPFGDELPGVEIHGVVAENLLSGRYLRDGGAPRLMSLAALLLLGPAVALLVALVERYWLGSLLAGVLILLWPVAAYGALVGPGWHLELGAPLLAGGIALVAVLRYQVGVVDARAREIRRVFGRYVSTEIVDEMLREPERVRLGGDRRELTVLFADLGGFTSLAENCDPETLTTLVNRIFTPLTRRVLAEGGTLDKYMGDALMAIFGAPVARADHAVRACRAAVGMIDELEHLNEQLRRERLLPEGVSLRLGVGLNTGEMVVGNMGSADIFDYTVLGDAVNLGSRIEGVTRLYDTAILVSGTTASAAGHQAFLFRELDRVRVKGRQEAVAIYELMAPRPAPAALEEQARRYGAALGAFRARRFAEAAAAFEALAREGDQPAARLASRAGVLAAAVPGPDWDAVEILTSK